MILCHRQKLLLNWVWHTILNFWKSVPSSISLSITTFTRLHLARKDLTISPHLNWLFLNLILEIPSDTLGKLTYFEKRMEIFFYQWILLDFFLSMDLIRSIDLIRLLQALFEFLRLVLFRYLLLNHKNTYRLTSVLPCYRIMGFGLDPLGFDLKPLSRMTLCSINPKGK